jgi:hypothetical protein
VEEERLQTSLNRVLVECALNVLSIAPSRQRAKARVAVTQEEITSKERSIHGEDL